VVGNVVGVVREFYFLNEGKLNTVMDDDPRAVVVPCGLLVKRERERDREQCNSQMLIMSRPKKCSPCGP
jgi:hypothetical protein